MKPLKIIACILLGLFISWIPAHWWNNSISPWCLHFFPKWADKTIYLIIRPLLSEDIGTAAEQMDFIEVWISTAVIIAVLMLTATIAYKYKSGKTALDT